VRHINPKTEKIWITFENYQSSFVQLFFFIHLLRDEFKPNQRKFESESKLLYLMKCKTSVHKVTKTN